MDGFHRQGASFGFNKARANEEVIIQSITRLDSFLRYLSDKIKSNTLKISSAEAAADNNQEFASLEEHS
jgi:hypothetical protein